MGIRTDTLYGTEDCSISIRSVTTMLSTHIADGHIISTEVTSFTKNSCIFSRFCSGLVHLMYSLFRFDVISAPRRLGHARHSSGEAGHCQGKKFPIQGSTPRLCTRLEYWMRWFEVIVWCEYDFFVCFSLQSFQFPLSTTFCFRNIGTWKVSSHQRFPRLWLSAAWKIEVMGQFRTIVVWACQS